MTKTKTAPVAEEPTVVEEETPSGPSKIAVVGYVVTHTDLADLAGLTTRPFRALSGDRRKARKLAKAQKIVAENAAESMGVMIKSFVEAQAQ